MKTPHTSCPAGCRVRVVTRDGDVVVDRFVERTSKFIILAGRRLRGRDIRSFTIDRNAPTRKT